MTSTSPENPYLAPCGAPWSGLREGRPDCGCGWGDFCEVAANERAYAALRKENMSIITINGLEITVPRGAVAWKYNDPLEYARWIYDQDKAVEIQRKDPTLIVWAPSAAPPEHQNDS